MTDPYFPISCGAHDELLARATLRRVCDISFISNSGSIERVQGRIADVYTRDGAEYMRLEDGTTIRLDRLRRVDDIDITPADV